MAKYPKQCRPCQRCSPNLEDTSISKPGTIHTQPSRLVCEAAEGEPGWHLLEIHSVGDGSWQLFDGGEPMHRPIAVSPWVTTTDLMHRLCRVLPEASIERDDALLFCARQPTAEWPIDGYGNLVCVTPGGLAPMDRGLLAEAVHLAGDDVHRAMFGDWRHDWPESPVSECTLAPPPGTGELLASWLTPCPNPACVGGRHPQGYSVDAWPTCPSCHASGTLLGTRTAELVEECDRQTRELDANEQDPRRVEDEQIPNLGHHH